MKRTTKEEISRVLSAWTSPLTKLNLLLRALSLSKVPLLGLCRPSVIQLDEQKSVVKIPLSRLAKNHVGSMYFGALSMGAELSVALPIVVEVFQKKRPINFLFTAFQIEFHRKATENIIFVFDGVPCLTTMAESVIASGDSSVSTFSGKAYLESEWREAESPIAQYSISISLKKT